MNNREQFKIPTLKTIGMIVFFLFSIGVLVCLLFVGGMSRYSGLKYIENSILNKSLKRVNSSVINSKLDSSNSKIRIVSFSKKDLYSGKITRSKYLLDASCEDYTDIILKIVSQKPQAIFISFMRPSHEGEQVELLDRLIDRIPEYKDRIFVIDSFTKIWSYSFSKINTVADFQCTRAPRLKCQSLQLKDSVFYKIKQFIPVDLKESDSYIFNIYPKRNIKTFSFTDIKEDGHDFKDSLVFLGNDIVQPRLSREKDESIVKRIKTLEDERSPLYQATPQHIYLARIARMLEEGTVAVDEGKQNIILWIFICAIVYLCLKRLFLVSILLIGTVSYLAPLINSFMIEKYGLYLSLGSWIYVSILLVLLTGLLFYFYIEYKNERLKHQSSLRQISFKLKSNFISLISHNLNTPISRLYSLLSIASMSGFSNKKLEQNIAGMFFTVKYALGIRAIKEIKGMKRTWTLSQLIQDFKDNMIPVLVNLGFSGISVEKNSSVDNLEAEPRRFLCNESIVELVLVAYLSLLKIKGYIQNDDKGSVKLNFSLEERDDQLYFVKVSFDLKNTEAIFYKLLNIDHILDNEIDTNTMAIRTKLLENYLEISRSKNLYELTSSSEILFKVNRS